MTQNDRNPEREYYLDRGRRDGMRDGDVLDVVRTVSITDGIWGGPNHLIRVVLGEVRVVLAGETASIARMQSQRPTSELPILDSAGFLIGDSVEVKTNLPSH